MHEEKKGMRTKPQRDIRDAHDQPLRRVRADAAGVRVLGRPRDQPLDLVPEKKAGQ